MTQLHPLLQQSVQQAKPEVEQVAMHSLFATPVFKYHISDYTYLTSLAQKVLSLRDKGTGTSAPNTWCSDDNLNDYPEFEKLNQIVLNESKQILDYLYIARDSHYITCMWSNVARVGHAHHVHIHPNSFLSGVVYLQIPPGSGAFFFKDPRPAINMILPNYTRPNVNLFGSQFRAEVKLGDMYIFPSWAEHGVQPSEWNPDAERISLSFNIMFKGETRATSARIIF